MIKFTGLFVFALIIGVAFTLPAGDSVNQRDPVQIKISNEEPIATAPLANNENIQPTPGLDLNDSFDPETLGIKDENLEPAETFGFGYGLLGYSGWGNGYRNYGGYGGGGYGGYGWGRRHGGYGGRGYGGYGWGNNFGGYGRRNYYW